MTDNSFNVDDVPEASFSLIPAGWYAATIEDVAYKAMNEGKTLTAIKFRIDENQHPNIGARPIFTNILWDGYSEEALDISRRNLAAICRAADVRTLEDKYVPNELLAYRIAIKITIQPARERNGRHYDEQNQVNGYASIAAREKDLAKPASGGSTGHGTTAPANPPAGQPSGSKPSWRKS